MRTLIVSILVLSCVYLSGCAIPEPQPASAEMKINPNDPAYIVLSPSEKDEVIGAYNDTE